MTVTLLHIKARALFGRRNARSKTMRERAQELRGCGSAAVEPILDVLEQYHIEGRLHENPRKLPVLCLLGVALPLAKPEHATRLARMLLWDEFLFKHHGSERRAILNALWRIGDETSARIIEEYLKRFQGTRSAVLFSTLIPNIPYITQCFAWDRKHAEKILVGIRKRST